MADEESITGIVEAVSVKTGGIKVSGAWYNPTEKTKDYVMKAKKGDNVSMRLGEDKKIAFFQITGKSSYANPVQSTAGYPASPGMSRDEQEMLNEADKAIIMDELRKKYSGIMQVCKAEVDRLFGSDEKYKDSMGQHCNSLFIALERAYKERRLL
jgi:hypothetical protein